MNRFENRTVLVTGAGSGHPTRPRTVPNVSTVSLKVCEPSDAELNNDMPPMEMPYWFRKLGADASTMTPKTRRFANM